MADEALKKSRRISMENMDIIKMTPDAKKAAAAAAANKGQHKSAAAANANSSLNKSGLLDEEDFFDFISRFQSKRMDDQRCSLTVPKAGDYPPAPPVQQQQLQNNQNSVNTGAVNKTSSSSTSAAAASSGGAQNKKEGHELMDLIAGVQSSRMNEQRAAVPFLPGLTKAKQPEILQR